MSGLLLLPLLLPLSMALLVALPATRAIGVKMAFLAPLGGALVLGGVFLWYAVRLMNPPNELYAMKVFNYSIVYLMALFAFLLIDHWLLPGAGFPAG